VRYAGENAARARKAVLQPGMVFAFEPNAYAAHWEGYRYAFLFSPSGELVEWSREELPDVKAPTAAR